MNYTLAYICKAKNTDKSLMLQIVLEASNQTWAKASTSLVTSSLNPNSWCSMLVTTKLDLHLMHRLEV